MWLRIMINEIQYVSLFAHVEHHSYIYLEPKTNNYAYICNGLIYVAYSFYNREICVELW